MKKRQLLNRTNHSTACDRRATDASGGVMQRHQQVIELLQRGTSISAIAAATGYSAYWVRVIAGRYHAADPLLLVDRRAQSEGAAPLLSAEQQRDLAAALQAPPPDGGRWTGPKVARWMMARTGRPVHRQRGWEYLRRLAAAGPLNDPDV